MRSSTNVRRPLSTLLAGLASAAALLAAACAPAGLDEDEPVDTKTAAVQHENHTELGFTWSSTSGPLGVTMTDVSNSFCFLAATAGSFKGNGDAVIISTALNKWGIGGSNSSGGSPAGSAFCATNVTQDGATATWTPGSAAVDLGTATARTCFLTAVWGNFSGITAQVRTRVSNGRWLLDGLGNAAGQARCVAKATWFPTSLSASSTGAVLFRDVSTGQSATNFEFAPWVCGLTRVQGVLRRGSSVRAYDRSLDTTNHASEWYIRNTPNADFPFTIYTPTGAGACIN